MTELEYWITLIIDLLVCLFVFAVESWTLESAESLSLAYLIVTPQISQPYATPGWHLARVFLPYPAPHCFLALSLLFRVFKNTITLEPSPLRKIRLPDRI